MSRDVIGFGNEQFSNQDEGWNMYETPIATIRHIQKAEDILASELAEAEKHQYLYEIAKDHLVRTVKSKVKYFWFDYFINDAIKWLEIIKGKYDKRKKYTERNAYDALNNTLSEALNVTAHIEEIITYFPNYMYTVVFTTAESDYVFALNVPNIPNLDTHNIAETQNGKLVFGSKLMVDYYRYMRSSYNLSDFANVLKDIVESGAEHKTKYEIYPNNEYDT